LGLPPVAVGSAEAFEIARRETRAAKLAATSDGELNEAWKREFDERLGMEPHEFVRSLMGKVRPAGLDREQRGEMFRDVAGRLTEHCPTFDRDEVIQAIARWRDCGMPAAEVLAEADRFLESRWAVPITSEGEREVMELRDGRTVAVPGDTRLWSTPDMVRTEWAVVRGAAEMRKRPLAKVEPEAAERAIAAMPVKLNQEQAEMVRSLTTSGEGIQVVEAGPGTGKTTAMRAAVAAWTAGGHQVLGAAIAAQAAGELEDGAGCPSRTTASLLKYLKGHRLPEGSVLVHDESGMLGTRMLLEVMRAAHRDHAKLVLVGDSKQLPEIDAGGAYAGLARRLGAIELTENHRQREEWDRRAIKDLREGEVADGVAAFHERGHVTYGEDADELAAEQVAAYFRSRDAGESPLMIAYLRRDRDKLNVLAREERVRRGEVGAEGLETSRYRIGVGDEVMARKNRWRLRVKNGTHGLVTGIEGEIVRMKTAKGDLFLPADYARAHLELGYAGNTHVVQGRTVDRAFPLITAEHGSREAATVAASRERLPGHIFFRGRPDSAELHGGERRPERDPAEQMVAAWERSRQQTMAIDLMDDMTATRSDLISGDAHAPDSPRTPGRSSPSARREAVAPALTPE
jgi:hypothetical protein